MMFEITDSFDNKQWDDFVQDHPDGNIFQTSDMAEVYRQTKNYEPISIAAIDPGSGKILAILQAVVIREMKGILGIFSSRSIIQGGPLFVDSKEGYEAITELLDKYDRIINKKAIYTQIRNMNDVTNSKEFFHNFGYCDHLNYLVDLNKEEKEIWSKIHKSRRKGINRAQNNGIEIVPVTDKEDILPFYDIVKETYKNVSIPLADISIFESAFRILGPKKMAKFYLAKHNDNIVGARTVLTYKGFVHDWYAGSLKSYSNMYINEALVWHILKNHASNGYSVFDFGGAGKPDEEYGVREFKRRFGGELVNFGRFERTHSKFLRFVAGAGFGVYKKLIR